MIYLESPLKKSRNWEKINRKNTLHQRTKMCVKTFVRIKKRCIEKLIKIIGRKSINEQKLIIFDY